MNRRAFFSFGMLSASIAKAQKITRLDIQQTDVGIVNPGPGLIVQNTLLQINPAAVRSYLTGSASLTFPPIPAQQYASRIVPVTGAVVGDKVVVGAPAELLTYAVNLTYAVTANGEVTIRLFNTLTTPINLPPWTWNVDVVKSF